MLPSHRHHRPRRHDGRGPDSAACARTIAITCVTWHPPSSRRNRLSTSGRHRWLSTFPAPITTCALLGNARKPRGAGAVRRVAGQRPGATAAPYQRGPTQSTPPPHPLRWRSSAYRQTVFGRLPLLPVRDSVPCRSGSDLDRPDFGPSHPICAPSRCMTMGSIERSRTVCARIWVPPPYVRSGYQQIIDLLDGIWDVNERLRGHRTENQERLARGSRWDGSVLTRASAAAGPEPETGRQRDGHYRARRLPATLHDRSTPQADECTQHHLGISRRRNQ